MSDDVHGGPQPAGRREVDLVVEEVDRRDDPVHALLRRLRRAGRPSHADRTRSATVGQPSSSSRCDVPGGRVDEQQPVRGEPRALVVRAPTGASAG